MKSKKQILIIGAGPAGLTAGYELVQTGLFTVTVLERDDLVGGLSKTIEYKKCRFDIGPHHFITESPRVLAWWKNIMRDDFFQLKRLTRIYYKRRFFYYPLQPLNAVRNLPIIESLWCIVSYVKAKIFPIRHVVSLQDWMINRFGYKLFLTFFKTYTERLWGVSCDKISADWAAQRIKNFSLGKAIFFAFLGKIFKKYTPRTIQDTFYYPSLGAGTLWESVVRQAEKTGNFFIKTGQNVVTIKHENNKIISVLSLDPKTSDISSGDKKILDKEYKIEYGGDCFFSSMPLSDFIFAMNPVPPDDVMQAAQMLRCRALVTVNLIVKKPNVCPDHWVYIHEKKVHYIRLGNMNNFSIKMVDHPEHTALSLEYFMFVGDALWQLSDQEFVEFGKKELEIVGLAKASDVIDGMIIRTPDAYPIYHENYKEHLQTVRLYLAQFKNLYLVGRNGTHSYNNMDAAMISAFSAVEELTKNVSV
jgi:protoporphyrinogen oxidase